MTPKERTFAELLRNIDALDISAVLRLFNEHAIYRDVPFEPEGARGLEAIRAKFEVCFKELTRLEMQIASIDEVADKVYSERVEIWHFKSGERASLPVLCVVEFDDQGKILHWREYWDSNSLYEQFPQHFLDYLSSLSG